MVKRAEADLIKLAEAACKKLATRELIPAEEILSWPLADELRIFPRGAKEILTAPVIERGRSVWVGIIECC